MSRTKLSITAIVVAILWVSSGIYGTGVFLAGCPYEFPLTYRYEGPNAFYPSAIVIGAAGPVGALISLATVNPGQMYGWRLRLPREVIR